MNDNQRETLLDFVSRLDDKLSSFLRYIENDKNIPEGSWRQIDDNANEVFFLISQLKEYLI